MGYLDAMRDTRLARLPSALHALPSYTKLAITFAEAAIEDVHAASSDDCFERVMKWAAAPWDVFPSTLYVWERRVAERSDMPR